LPLQYLILNLLLRRTVLQSLTVTRMAAAQIDGRLRKID